MNPITTLGEVSNRMNKMLRGIHRTKKITVAFVQMLGICSLFFLERSSSAWLLETKGKIGEIKKR